MLTEKTKQSIRRIITIFGLQCKCGKDDFTFTDDEKLRCKYCKKLHKINLTPIEKN